MIYKFTIASFRETDRIEKTMPMYLTNHEIKTGKEQQRRVWEYDVTDTQGNVWELRHQKKRVNLKDGQTILCLVIGKRIHGILLLADFNMRIGREIDRQKELIQSAEIEIARLKAL